MIYLKRFKHFTLVFGVILLVLLKISCKKIDTQTKDIEEKINTTTNFFDFQNIKDSTVIRLMLCLKRKNEAKNFVKEATQKLGIPYWNKALLYSTKTPINGRGNNRDNGNDTTIIAYIPLVQNTQTIVSGQLTIKATPTDTTFGFIANTDYKKFGFESNADSLLNGLKVFALFSRHEKNIFGYTKFNIIDNRILKGLNGIAIDSTKKYMLELQPDNVLNNRSFASSKPPLPSSSCMIVNNYVSSGFTVNYYQIGATCVITSFGEGYDGTSGDGLPIPQSGGGGSSSRNDTTNNNGGLGWGHQPSATILQINPCDTVNKYAQGADFQAMFNNLKTEVPTRKENMYIFNNTLIPSSASNPIHYITGFDDKFEVYPQNELQFKNSWGWFHNHFSDADSASYIFSAGDINVLADQIIRDSTYFKVDYKHFMIGVVADSNTQYIMMVEDLDKFAVWLNLYNNEQIIGSAFKGNQLTQSYLPLTIAETEKRFLKIIQNAGLRVMRGSNDFKNWTGIKLDATGTNVTTAGACPTMTLTF
jgi:hypothetical protein